VLEQQLRRRIPLDSWRELCDATMRQNVYRRRFDPFAVVRVDKNESVESALHKSKYYSYVKVKLVPI